MASGSGPSPFAQALHGYGLSRCSVKGVTIWVGLGPDPDYRREPLDRVPDPLRSLCFVEAPEQADLIRLLMQSPEAAQLEHLMIGTSHDYARGRPIRYDMSGAVAALNGARLPNLRQLSLGDMEMLFNGHKYFGTLGDITHLFAAAPALDELRLHGHFSLGEPVAHDRIQEISIDLDDIGVSGGPLSQESLSHLLSSAFPRLQSLHLDLDEGELDASYSIPDAFFAARGLPALRDLSVNCLTREAEARLTTWKRAQAKN